MYKTLILLTLVSTMFLTACTQTAETTQSDQEQIPIEESELEITSPESGLEVPLDTQLTSYTQRADLTDVTGGDSSGEAMAGFIDTEYKLMATFENLPPLEDEEAFFYEGWVVRKEPQSVISTGALEKNADGMYLNTFTDTRDLTDHTLYVLTLEPNDGDPAPAEHVVEGMFEEL